MVAARAQHLSCVINFICSGRMGEELRGARRSSFRIYSLLPPTLGGLTAVVSLIVMVQSQEQSLVKFKYVDLSVIV